MIEQPTAGMGMYLAALRWESRLVISLLITTPIAYISASFSGPNAVWCVTAMLALVGTLLAFGFRRALRKDYLHIDGVWLVLGILPPFCFAAIIFGMIQTWMERVGFSLQMRVSVVTTIATLLAVVIISDNIALIVVFLLVSFVSALLRELADQNWYLLPCIILSIAAMVFAW